MDNHFIVDIDKWRERSIFSQMGNIGSEVGRAISARIGGNKSREESATERALDLFDATSKIMADEKSPRLKEILRARENFLEILQDFDEDDARGLEKYFMNFAIAERNKL